MPPRSDVVRHRFPRLQIRWNQTAPGCVRSSVGAFSPGTGGGDDGRSGVLGSLRGRSELEG
nr:hypothetical protein JVH1_5273 [Rhodococcus sp. JVH1]